VNTDGVALPSFATTAFVLALQNRATCDGVPGSASDLARPWLSWIGFA
jgi:hypothetical protein